MSFEIPTYLNFSAPSKVLENEVNNVHFKPISGATFGPSDNIKFKITSNNAFLRPSKCFLKYNIALSGGDSSTTSASTTTYVGSAAGIISRVETSVSGLRVEDINDYGLYVSKLYQKSTSEYKDLLKALEGYNDISNATFINAANTDTIKTARTVCHALRTCIFEAPTDVPLCFLRGGLEMTIYTGALLAFINTAQAATPQTTFVITNVSMVCGMIKVPDSYLTSFQQSLEKGNTAKIPLSITRSISTALVASTDNDVQLQVGFLKSLNSILGITRLSAEINTNTKDTFNLMTRDGLDSWYTSNGSERFPRDHEITCLDTNYDPTALMYALMSIDNNYNHFGQTAAGYQGATQFDIFQSFTPAPGQFGTGMTVTDGSITVHLDYGASSPTALSKINWFINYSALLSISNSGVSLDSTSF